VPREKPEKLTRVTRALRTSADKGQPIAFGVGAEELGMPSFVPRLSFRTGSRVPSNEADLVAFLRSAEDTTIFMDSSGVGRDIDYKFWDEMLRVPERVYVTTQVLRELAEHFRAVPEHPLRKAIAGRNPAFRLYRAPRGGTPAADACRYYVSLLVNRRFVLQRRIERHVRETGTQPTTDDLRILEAEIHRDFGERGMLLCKKPPSPLLTDEMLVYFAIAHAVETGEPTMILASDHDVEEQFVKAIELVTIHYYAMLVGREYQRDPVAMRPHALDVAALNLDGLFESATVLDVGRRRVQDFKPPTYTFVPISCTLIGPYFSHLTYGAETAMAEVLDIKGRTRGKSTDWFGDRDVHAYFIPEAIAMRDGHRAVISTDVYEPGTDLKISKLDKLAALNTRLSMSPVTAVPTSTTLHLPRDGGRPTG
jgi:hypothetical protein